MNFHWMPEGTVYGTLMNFHREHALWAPRMSGAPYKAPPQAPVLYIKTANTFTAAGQSIALPVGQPVAVAATLGLVMGDTGVAGAVLFNDLAIVHESYYRPPVKFQCVDGFLGIGPECVPLQRLGGLDGLNGLQMELRINGVHRQTTALAELVRDAATLLADVNEFMTLRLGDVLMLGSDCLPDGSRPLVHAGDTVEISATGFKPAVHSFVAEEKP
ncbi:MAG: fumarylacetoacetate hydrolase family protein [Hydrogenophaga sp.]|uniref:fumarylacetoacetate hydrolase family protein n=1 Tax=Hydrogenophaga sp. TaxID=1904254 RepID=UPI002733CBAA|nr:fumarylacetoacetate hydrolase family protein [Hydrogenophaga sp.]MDP3204776.1 fumarylacetoacetate hydrolase family protein [Hydrogenophaga sp.]MDP3625785.1 fumarylacetoacetate hydrolase family protein [Hydrogenophaga sp.]